jgi:hypothetical protein
MHGNVAEWCEDWYDPEYYKTRPLQDPRGPLLGQFRALRGGSRHLGWMFCRSAHRGRAKADVRSDDIGFRVVLRLSPWTEAPIPQGDPVHGPQANPGHGMGAVGQEPVTSTFTIPGPPGAKKEKIVIPMAPAP